MKEKNYRKSTRAGHDRIIPIWPPTTNGQVLYRWSAAGVSKLIPALFLYGLLPGVPKHRPAIKSGRKLPCGSYCPTKIKSNQTLSPCSKSHFEIELFPPETLFFIPSEHLLKSIIPRRWQRFTSSGGRV